MPPMISEGDAPEELHLHLHGEIVGGLMLAKCGGGVWGCMSNVKSRITSPSAGKMSECWLAPTYHDPRKPRPLSIVYLPPEAPNDQ